MAESLRTQAARMSTTAEACKLIHEELPGIILMHAQLSGCTCCIPKNCKESEQSILQIYTSRSARFSA